MVITDHPENFSVILSFKYSQRVPSVQGSDVRSLQLFGDAQTGTFCDCTLQNLVPLSYYRGAEFLEEYLTLEILLCLQ